ncbi:hypothetical protein [Sphingomonas aquatilis]
MTGFYLMHRGWQGNPVFRNEEFSKRDAFVWLIEEAAYRPTRIHAATGALDLKRGQLSHSLRFMAKAWRWDEAKVRRFLASLVKAEIIDAATDAGQTVVTICNYDKYQAPIPANDAGDDAGTTQQRRSDDANLKEGNKGKKEEEGEAKASPRAKRAGGHGSHLPDDWQPSRFSDGTVAREIIDRRGSDWARRVFESFRNHWRSANGPTARKRDWQAAWANWVIEQDKRDGRHTDSMARNGGAGSQPRGRTIDAALAFIADGQPH